MSFSDTLGLLGIFISTLFGIWGLFVGYKSIRYPGEITFFLEQEISLLNDSALKIPNLELKYKDKTLEDNIILLSGHILNSGNQDVSQSMIEKPLSCLLPEGFKWLEFKITGESNKDLQISANLNSPLEINFNLGLFRKNESFNFQALVLTGKNVNPKNDSLSKLITWSHRIANVAKIKCSTIPKRKALSRKQWARKNLIPLTTIFAYFIFGVFLICGYGPITNKPQIIYNLTDKDKTYLVKLIPHQDKTTLIYINDNKSIDIDLHSFTKNNSLTPINSLQKDEANFPIGIALVFGAIIMFFMSFYQDIKKYRIYRILNKRSPT
jgi:hypothetical protein